MMPKTETGIPNTFEKELFMTFVQDVPIIHASIEIALIVVK